MPKSFTFNFARYLKMAGYRLKRDAMAAQAKRSRVARRKRQASSRVGSARSGGKVYPTSLSRMPTYKFQRIQTAIIQLTNTSSSFSVLPELDGIQGYADLVALFDEYRITRYEVTFYPDQMGANQVSVVTPYIWCVNDFNGTGPTTEVQFMERPDARRLLLDKPRTWVCDGPRIASGMMNAAGILVPAGVAPAGTWLDLSASATIRHFGSYFLQNSPSAGMTVNGYVKLFVECKSAR